ncbi:unnamed protein product [Diamesa hyperborea]
MSSHYSPDEIRTILLNITSDPDVFKYGNSLIPEFKRLGVLPDEKAVLAPLCDDTIICNVPNCKKSFNSIKDYESHYKTHMYSCNQCKKSLPSAHLLDLHISETHDSFFALLKLKKPMYYCFSEGCKHISLTPKERKDHCLKEHLFPSNFRFDKSVKTEKAPKTIKMDVTDDDEAAGKSHNSNYTRPYHFGSASQRTFRHVRKPKAEPLESMVVDFKESLPDV